MAIKAQHPLHILNPKSYTEPRKDLETSQPKIKLKGHVYLLYYSIYLRLSRTPQEPFNRAPMVLIVRLSGRIEGSLGV